MILRSLFLTIGALVLLSCSSPGTEQSMPNPPPTNARTPVSEGGMCGGFAGFQCADGLRCQMPDGHCQVADGAGTCRKAPRMCTMIYAPVCGCDGKTYASACTAAAAGASIATQGECKA